MTLISRSREESRLVFGQLILSPDSVSNILTRISPFIYKFLTLRTFEEGISHLEVLGHIRNQQIHNDCDHFPGLQQGLGPLTLNNMIFRSFRIKIEVFKFRLVADHTEFKVSLKYQGSWLYSKIKSRTWFVMQQTKFCSLSNYTTMILRTNHFICSEVCSIGPFQRIDKVPESVFVDCQLLNDHVCLHLSRYNCYTGTHLTGTCSCDPSLVPQVS